MHVGLVPLLRGGDTGDMEPITQRHAGCHMWLCRQAAVSPCGVVPGLQLGTPHLLPLFASHLSLSWGSVPVP